MTRLTPCVMESMSVSRQSFFPAQNFLYISSQNKVFETFKETSDKALISSEFPTFFHASESAIRRACSPDIVSALGIPLRCNEPWSWRHLTYRMIW